MDPLFHDLPILCRRELKGRAPYPVAVHARLSEAQFDKLRVVEVQRAAGKGYGKAYGAHTGGSSALIVGAVVCIAVAFSGLGLDQAVAPGGQALHKAVCAVGIGDDIGITVVIFPATCLGRAAEIVVLQRKFDAFQRRALIRVLGKVGVQFSDGQFLGVIVQALGDSGHIIAVFAYGQVVAVHAQVQQAVGTGEFALGAVEPEDIGQGIFEVFIEDLVGVFLVHRVVDLLIWYKEGLILGGVVLEFVRRVGLEVDNKVVCALIDDKALGGGHLLKSHTQMADAAFILPDDVALFLAVFLLQLFKVEHIGDSPGCVVLRLAAVFGRNVLHADSQDVKGLSPLLLAVFIHDPELVPGIRQGGIIVGENILAVFILDILGSPLGDLDKGIAGRATAVQRIVFDGLLGDVIHLVLACGGAIGCLCLSFAVLNFDFILILGVVCEAGSGLIVVAIVHHKERDGIFRLDGGAGAGLGLHQPVDDRLIGVEYVCGKLSSLNLIGHRVEQRAACVLADECAVVCVKEELGALLLGDDLHIEVELGVVNGDCLVLSRIFYFITVFIDPFDFVNTELSPVYLIFEGVTERGCVLFFVVGEFILRQCDIIQAVKVACREFFGQGTVVLHQAGVRQILLAVACRGHIAVVLGEEGMPLLGNGHLHHHILPVLQAGEGGIAQRAGGGLYRVAVFVGDEGVAAVLLDIEGEAYTGHRVLLAGERILPVVGVGLVDGESAQRGVCEGACVGSRPLGECQTDLARFVRGVEIVTLRRSGLGECVCDLLAIGVIDGTGESQFTLFIGSASFSRNTCGLQFEGGALQRLLRDTVYLGQCQCTGVGEVVDGDLGGVILLPFC